MATSTRDTASKTKFDASATLDEKEATAAAVEERVRELENEHEAKRRVLEGPDRNLPGLVDELRDLRTRDPEQFQPDGTPVGPDAKRLADQIDEVGPLEPLAQKIQHERPLAAKAKRDVGSFIGAHIDAIFAARRPQAEQRLAAVRAARDHLIDTIDQYRDFATWVMGMLAAAHRDNYVAGLDQATNFKKSLAGDLCLTSPSRSTKARPRMSNEPELTAEVASQLFGPKPLPTPEPDSQTEPSKPADPATPAEAQAPATATDASPKLSPEQAELARRYGLSPENVKRVRGETWGREVRGRRASCRAR